MNLTITALIMGLCFGIAAGIAMMKLAMRKEIRLVIKFHEERQELLNRIEVLKKCILEFKKV